MEPLNVVKLEPIQEHKQKLCTQCKYGKKGPTFMRCTNINVLSASRSAGDYLSGDEFGMFASTARDFSHLCGVKGKYFEPKPPTIWQQFYNKFISWLESLD